MLKSLRKILTLFFFIAATLIWAQGTVVEELSDREKAAQKLNDEGIALANKGKYEAALVKFKKAAILQDDDASVSHNNIGYGYLLLGEDKKAIAAYRKAVERNPEMVEALQNLGELLYKSGQYNEAIIHGEKVISLDPKNKEVASWLPDAYRHQTEQRLFALDKYNTGDDAIETPPSREDTFTIELGYRMNLALYWLKDSGLVFESQAGLVKIPQDFYVNFWARENFEIRFVAGTPFFGVVNPRFLAGREKIEFLYHGEKAFYGVGMLFTQANFSYDQIPSRGIVNFSFRNNQGYDSVSDSKLGFIFGFKADSGIYKISFFPRYLFRDESTSPIKTEFDAAQIGFDYSSKAYFSQTDWPFRFNISVLTDEIYVTEYTIAADGANRGQYFGKYDFSFSFEFKELKPVYGSIPYTLGFGYTQRLYFRDLGNSDPFAFGNGQGFFGFNTAGAVQGNTFSGFRSNAHIITFFSRQLLTLQRISWMNNLYLRESIGFEITNSAEEAHAFYFKLDVSTRY